jgi:hypothetical protein
MWVPAHQINQPTDLETPMPRKLILWSRSEHLMLLKTLAWAVWKHETTNKDKLWRRVAELCEPAMERLTGETGVAFESICAATLAAQGVEITPNKLAQRADKLDRYMEVGTLMMERVERVYLSLAQKAEAA